MGTQQQLEQGRAAYTRQAWAEAYEHLAAADAEPGLELDDLERLATAAYLLGRLEDSAELWARTHHACLDAGDAPRAARCAFWLGFGLLRHGEMARAGGWLGRAHSVLEEAGEECVEHGLLMVPAGIQSLEQGDHEAGLSAFEEAYAIAVRHDDPDLMTFATLGRGRGLIYAGAIDEGLSLLDEVMVAVTAGEVSPILAGAAYCAVIEACQEVFDLRRAQEWTAALRDWCAAQPDLVAYRGQCLVHRSQLLQLHGAWPDAMEVVQDARERLSGPPGTAAGVAYYQQAELHRLRGELDEAEQAYREAHRLGHDPQPGLAQLRLAQGQLDAAEAAIRRVFDETQDRVARAKVLPAYVEILLAAGDVQAARQGADELTDLADAIDAPLVHAVASHAVGAVLLAEGDARAAFDTLRRSWSLWQEVEAPYEAARVRVRLAMACRELGDGDTAELELDAARWAFEELGAAHDAARVAALLEPAASEPAGGLTGREVEVLRLVAAGKTNREVADELVISEKTVARHLSNVFTKLGLSNRAAATAYAYEHDLI